MWSPNTMKIRTLLNLKGIPFTTSFHTFATFPDLLTKEGVSPNKKGPTFTLPALTHNGKTIMTSEAISAYLETAPEFQAYSKSMAPEVEGMERLFSKTYRVVFDNAAAFTTTIMLPEDRASDVNALLADDTTRAANGAKARAFINSFEGFTTEYFSPEQLAQLKKGDYLFGDKCTYADCLYYGVLYWAHISNELDKQAPPLITDTWLRNWYNRMNQYSDGASGNV